MRARREIEDYRSVFEAGMSSDGECPAIIKLKDDVVYVVRIALDTAYPEGEDVLDLREHERARRFVFQRDRRRFVAAHVWTRIIIARCFDCAPEFLRFAANSHGKPRLVNPPYDLRFNLSHSGELACLSLALGREVGVDIEEEKPIDVRALARQFFATCERKQIESLPKEDRRSAFFRVWTRKESFIKALGLGLSFPLDGFHVSVMRDASPQLLRGCRADPDALQRWRMVSLAIGEGYAAAVTAETGEWRVVQWNVHRTRRELGPVRK